MPSYTFITISDVHHGHKPYDEMKNEFYAEGGFFDILDSSVSEPEFIGIGILGDWFDKKLDVNDLKAKLAISIIADIVSRCMPYNKQIIILRGTYSHDLNQLDIFREWNLMYSGIQLVNTLSECKFGPLKVLCIPEEYPLDQDDYYRESFSKKYDAIFGHGFFDQNCFDSNEAEKTMPRMPIFSSDLFKDLAPITIFGHDHTHKNFFGKIWYNGSFSRLCHGEEGPKGFLYIEWNKKKPIATFIENELAPLFITVVLDVIMLKSKLDISFESIVSVVENTKKKLKAKELKVKVTPKFASEYTHFLEIAKTYFASKDGYKFETGRLDKLKDGKVIEIEEDQSEKVVTEYDFLLRPGNVVDKVVQFINIKYGNDKEITAEDVSKAIAPSKTPN